MRTLVFAAPLTLAIGGCVTDNVVALNPGAAGVTLVREDDKPFRCKTLGDVHGTSRSTDREAARRGAEADLRNRAAELKATHVVVLADRGGKVGSSSHEDAFMSGKALRCEEEKEPKE